MSSLAITGSATVALLFLAAAPAVAWAEEEKAQGWEGKVNLGSALSVGENTVFAGNLAAEAERKWESDSLRFGLKAQHSINRGDVTSSQSATQRFRHYYRESAYGYQRLELGRDTNQSINWRVTGSVGPGWRVWQENDSEYLDLEAGFGYAHLSYRGDTSDRDEFGLRAAYDFANKIGKSLEFTHDLELLLPVNAFNRFSARSGFKISLPVANSWHVTNSLGIEYRNDPAAGAKRFNLDAVAGLEYRF